MQAKQERLPLLKTELEQPRHEIVGLLWMALSALFFGVSGLFVRYVTAYGGLSAASVVLVRGLIQTVLMLGAISVAPDGRDVFRNTPRLWGLLALHGGSGALGILALFGSFKLLDLSVASAIYYTNPVIVLLFGSIALKERVRPPIALAAFISLLGAIMVTDPFRQEAPTSTLGVVLGFSAATIGALSYTTLRAIANRVSFMASVLAFGLFSILVGLLAGGAPDLAKSVYLTGVAALAEFLAVCAQCSIAKGYELCTAGKGALVRNIELPLAYVFGVAFLAEVPNAVSIAGGVLVLIATLIIGHDAIENERQQEAAC